VFGGRRPKALIPLFLLIPMSFAAPDLEPEADGPRPIFATAKGSFREKAAPASRSFGAVSLGLNARRMANLAIIY
jgi:hypothetical protein